MNQVKAFVSELMEAGFPETDVVIPDVVKYLEFFDFYFKRRLKGITVLVVASFFNDYYSIVVLKDDHYRSCRMVFSIFWDYMDVVAENTGIQPKELFEGMVEVSLDFLQPYFGDFLLELDREVKISLDEVSLDIADQFFYIIDPPVFFQSFMQALQKFEGTVLKEGPVPFVKSSVSMGGLGLVLRGEGKLERLNIYPYKKRKVKLTTFVVLLAVMLLPPVSFNVYFRYVKEQMVENLENRYAEILNAYSVNLSIDSSKTWKRCPESRTCC